MAPKSSSSSSSKGKLRSSTSSSLTSSKPKPSSSTLKRSSSLTGAFSSAKSGAATSKDKDKKVKQEQVVQLSDEGEDELDPAVYKVLLKESKRKMGTAIHADDWTDLTIILRVFDADLEYGPCSNTSRLERYNRAVSLGLNPPSEIGQILTSKLGREKPEYRLSTFNI